MADTGQPWVLRYPLLTDPPNGPVATQQLAEAVHAALGYAYPCLSTARPTNMPGLIINEADTGLMYIGDGATWSQISKGYDDTGWIDILSAGWTPVGTYVITSGQVLRRNGFVSFYMNVTAPATLAGGDYANQSVAQAPPGYIPAQQNGAVGSGTAGNSQNGSVTVAGVVVVASGEGMTAATGFSLTGVYAL